MSAVDDFLDILSGAQLDWFKRQPKVKQAAMAASWMGSGKTPGDIVQDNGGPAPQGGADTIPAV
ncbi:MULTISPECIES: hypothetical protein [unclassified Streptomyces]|uniref:hypothetical protein n=1 Tax=unclassified Streptomyces TaxID=2593676 RepID=UPI00093CE758|nr:hypothetical protein [Streptomyces sp. TSRI0281]OKI40771.1 hypothetical protein A6A29_38965 [Streptomyces sp. TSRI0281]